MIDLKTVEYIASLSRLHVEADKAVHLAQDLEKILGYIEKLKEVDVSHVRPTSHVLDVENVFREDEVVPSLSHEEAFSFAIEQFKGHYKVPKVIE